MFIILDTNIIVESWLFDKPYHQAFLDFIDVVDCHVVFPQIVWSELKAQYHSQLKDAINKKASADRIVSKFLYKDRFEKLYDIPAYIDIDEEYKKYSDVLMQRLRGGPHSIIEYPEGILPLLAEKAIARAKPFSNSGEEFRDAILWHSVLELAVEYDEFNPIVFISKNTREFADPINKNNLHPQLINEVRSLGDKVVLYYSSLEEFIKAHQTPIKHVDFKWINQHLPDTMVDDLVVSYIQERADKLIPYLNRAYPDIIFDEAAAIKNIKLVQPGLEYFNLDEMVYTHKDGTMSVFLKLSGQLNCGTTYAPRFQLINLSQNITRNNQMNIPVFSAGYMELGLHFFTNVEFELKSDKLVYKGIASLKIITQTDAYYENMSDHDLPF